MMIPDRATNATVAAIVCSRAFILFSDWLFFLSFRSGVAEGFDPAPWASALN